MAGNTRHDANANTGSIFGLAIVESAIWSVPVLIYNASWVAFSDSEKMGKLNIGWESFNYLFEPASRRRMEVGSCARCDLTLPPVSVSTAHLTRGPEHILVFAVTRLPARLQ